MDCYLFELPTTGAISFTETCIDTARKYATCLSSATSARAALRAALKENKRGEKDYLKVVKIIEDYLPHVYAIVNTVATGGITFQAEPVFSWRTTLSSNLFQSSPRVPVLGFAAELTFTLLTYGFALSNLARSNVLSLGNYEHDRHITDTERRTKDERLNFAVNLLSQASGVYLHIAEVVLPQCIVSQSESSKRLPELNTDVITALSHLALADAQNLTIRKFMSQSAYDSVISPGPPLPKSHPSPVVIAKLYICTASSYSSARNLAETHSEGDVCSDLRKYLDHEAILAQALAHKWLGVDAGETRARTGDAISFLKWAKADLESLGVDAKKVLLAKGRENMKPKKSRITDELTSISSFLQNYKKMNDTVHFQPIPPVGELQSSIPTGRTVVSSTHFEPPAPAFNLESCHYESRVGTDTGVNSKESNSSGAPYARAGSYF